MMTSCIQTFLLLENEPLLQPFRALGIKITHVELMLLESQANSIHIGSLDTTALQMVRFEYAKPRLTTSEG